MTPPDNFSGTPKENLRAIRILCIALITGLLLFSIISIIMNQFIGPFINETKQYTNIFLWVLAIVSSICVLATIKQYSKGITTAKENIVSLNDKLNQYRTALVIYLALCEGPALFSVIVFLLTGNFIALGFTAIMVGMMLAKFPTTKRAVSELDLNWQEQQQLE